MKYERLDLTGQRFGKLVVVEPDHSDNKRGWWWRCQCDCGKRVIIPSGNLRSGSTISCGCYHRGQEKYDLTGKRFGRLVAIKELEPRYTKSGRKIRQYECKCDCGNTINVDAWHLTDGKITSCKCYRHERQVEANIRHGQHGSRLYNIWGGMIQRCKNRPDYAHVSVCEEWQKFEPFYEWSMSHGYADDLTIDRIDSRGNYEPSNCRWATWNQQANNTCRNRYIEIDGVVHTLAEWVALYGAKYERVRDRIDRGWEPKRALETPKMQVRMA